MDLLMAVCNELFLKSVQLYLFRQNEFNSVFNLSQMDLLMTGAVCQK